MLKKFLICAVAAVLMFASLSAAAISARIVDSNNQYYWVVISNDTSFRLFCVLTATNGAYYEGYVQAYSTSHKMRINDKDATYSYVCHYA